MTLVIGANLCDRIYLSADTRVTYLNTGQFRDDQHKLAQINPNIVVGCAGSLDLVNFIVSKMRGWVTAETSIDQFIRAVDTELPKALDWLFLTYPRMRALNGAKLLIAGVDRTRQKTIKNSGKIVTIVGERQRQLQTRIDALGAGRDIGKLSLLEQQELGRLVTMKMMAMRDVLLDAVMRGPNPQGELTISAPHSALYSLIVRCDYSLPIIKEHQWGEVAVAGSFDRLEDEDAFFVDVELNMNSGHPLRDSLLFVQKTVEKFKKEVGGAITPAVISNEGISFMFGEVHAVLSDGTKKRLFETKFENGVVYGSVAGGEFKSLKELKFDTGGLSEESAQCLL